MLEENINNRYYVLVSGIGRDHAKREELARYTNRASGHRSRAGLDRVLHRAAVAAVPRSAESRQ